MSEKMSSVDIALQTQTQTKEDPGVAAQKKAKTEFFQFLDRLTSNEVDLSDTVNPLQKSETLAPLGEPSLHRLQNETSGVSMVTRYLRRGILPGGDLVETEMTLFLPTDGRSPCLQKLDVSFK